jgi:peptidyl-prolyl cis-trans isomerase C
MSYDFPSIIRKGLFMIRRTSSTIFAIATIVSMALAAAGPVGAQDAKAPAPGSKPVSVNGKVIPKARVDFVAKDRVAQGQADNDQLRGAILDTLINQEILAQEAEKKGLAKSSTVQMQVDLARQEILARAIVNDHLKSHAVKDDAVRAEYDKIKSQRASQEYRARHILVDKEDEAKAIIDRIKKGEKFEDLAKLSKDPGSKDRGGDLDWASPTNFVKPFGDAMTKLEKGKFTEAPVQTQFGWHVIRLDDVRTTQFPPFDEVKQQIVNFMQNQEIQKLVSELRSKAKIE